MYKLINYIDVVSNAFLGMIDCEDNYTLDVNDKIYIELTKDKQNLMRFFIQQSLKSEICFGVTNIVLNTCRPFDNWRKESRGSAIKAQKYSITDDSFTTNKQKLEYFLDTSWNWLQKQHKNTIFISGEDIDILDLTLSITNWLGIRSNPRTPYYHIIGDMNIDYNRNDDIPDYIHRNIEEILIQQELLTP